LKWWGWARAGGEKWVGGGKGNAKRSKREGRDIGYTTGLEKREYECV